MISAPRPTSGSDPDARTTDLMPTSRAPRAAFTLASMPPRPPLEIPPNFQSFNEAGCTSRTNRAPASDGGRSYNPSTSVSMIRQSAPTSLATKAANPSLSEKHPSGTSEYPALPDTASFSLMMGTMPTSMMAWMECCKFFLHASSTKSRRVTKNWDGSISWVANNVSYKDMRANWPAAAAAAE